MTENEMNSKNTKLEIDLINSNKPNIYQILEVDFGRKVTTKKLKSIFKRKYKYVKLDTDNKMLGYELLTDEKYNQFKDMYNQIGKNQINTIEEFLGMSKSEVARWELHDKYVEQINIGKSNNLNPRTRTKVDNPDYIKYLTEKISNYIQIFNQVIIERDEGFLEFANLSDLYYNVCQLENEIKDNPYGFQVKRDIMNKTFRIPLVNKVTNTEFETYVKFRDLTLNDKYYVSNYKDEYTEFLSRVIRRKK